MGGNRTGSMASEHEAICEVHELWRVIVFPLSLSLTLLRMDVTLCKQILVLL